MAYSDRNRSPGMWTLALAVLFPALVILIELATGICADALFDPLPTPGHLLLVSAVPAVNFFLWRAARAEKLPGWLALASGAAMAVAASYALLMLPILPIALIAIIFLGIGLLPFAPLFSLIFAWRLTMRLAEYGTHVGRRVFIGAAGGLLALALVDLPATATYLALERYRGDEAAQRSAINLMRAVGDSTLLLRMAYGDTQRATGLMSFLVSSWGRGFDDGWQSNSNDSRELYYRLTGTPFNAVTPPNHGLQERQRWFAWDADQGGEAVGQRITGLSLASSRIDGSIASADNLGYFEWTVEVSNADRIQHEARFTIAMPEGAVASRATLWIDGEPREASVAGRAETRAAYNKVVNVQRRDPLLITTDGAQRLLVQAFPISPGGTIKLRVGYTAPLAIAPDGKRSVALPAIVERNFELGADLRHEVWIEGDGALAGSGGGAPQPGGTGNGLRGAPTDAELLSRRPRIVASPLTAPSERLGSMPPVDKAPPLGVMQTIAPVATPAAQALTIVLDGSAGNAAAGKALGEALDAIPVGMRTRLLIASDVTGGVAAAPWSPAQKQRFRDAIGGTQFRGGQDSVPALGDALREMAGGQGVLLWIHGPQPLAFSRSTARLEQVLERSARLPELVRYQLEPGREFTLNGAPWFDRARDVTPTGDARGDLRGILAGTGAGTRWTTARREAPATGTEGSAHIVRLWGADQLAGATRAKGKEREAAITLAHRLNLVTPLSGAVVLEKASDYKDNGLPVPGAEDVPTVPEPEEWALLAVLAGLLAWVFRKRLRFPVWPTRRATV